MGPVNLSLQCGNLSGWSINQIGMSPVTGPQVRRSAGNEWRTSPGGLRRPSSTYLIPERLEPKVNMGLRVLPLLCKLRMLCIHKPYLSYFSQGKPMEISHLIHL